MKLLRWGRLIAATGVTLILTTSTGAQQKDIAVDPVAGIGPRAGYADSWALIIGVNDYLFVPRLRAAANDAMKLHRTLLTHGFREDRIVTLIDKEATRRQILLFLTDRLGRKIGPMDRLLIFFSGHAVTQRPTPSREEGFLLPVDGDPNNLPLTAIEMAEIVQTLNRLPAKHILLIIDACMGGYSLRNYRDITRSLDAMLGQPAVEVLTAGRKGETCMERGEHGLLTELLLRGLEGEAFLSERSWISAAELSFWVQGRVIAESKGTQHPEYGRLSGEGGFIFFRPRVPASPLGQPVPAPSPGVVTPPPAHAPSVPPTEGRVESKSAGAGILVNPYPNSWAVVVGINAYQKVTPRLNYAVADAKAVAAALPDLGFPRQNIRLLLDKDATKSKIEEILYQEFAGMGEGDRLFVFFAGHGETAKIKGGEEGYILPVNADPKALPLTAIPMDDVKRIGQRVKAKHVLFVLDACFSGFALVRDVVPQAVTDEYVAAALQEPVVQVLTAGRKGERAIEEGGHGLFTRQLLAGLRGLADPEGRGLLTAAQLAAWIEPRVARDSKGKMTPQYTKLDGEGQFIFTLPRRGSAQ